MDPEVCCERVVWIHMYGDKIQFRCVVNAFSDQVSEYQRLEDDSRFHRKSIGTAF